MKNREEDLVPEIQLRQQIEQLKKQREREFIGRVEALATEYGLTLKAVPVITSDGKLTAQVVVAEK